MNPRSLKNLKAPFRKGCKPGPGRPKGSLSLARALKKLLASSLKSEDPLDGIRKHLTVAEVIALTLVHKGMQGHLKAIREIIDRTEGKAGSRIEKDECSHDEWVKMVNEYHQNIEVEQGR